MHEDDLLSQKEAQDLIGVSKATFYRYIKQGHISPCGARRVGAGAVGHTYRRGDIQRFAAELAAEKRKGPKPRPKPVPHQQGTFTTWIKTARLGPDGEIHGAQTEEATCTEDAFERRESERLAYIAELATEIDGLDLPDEDKAYIKRSLRLNREATPRQREQEEKARAEFLEAYEDALRKANAPQEATSRDGDGNGKAGRRTPRRTAKATETAGEEDPP